LDLVKGTSIRWLVIDNQSREGLASVLPRAETQGLKVVDDKTPPAGVHIVKGQWPGANPLGRESDTSPQPAISAGPTAEPWVDANGWLIRFWSQKNPGDSVWLDAIPAKPVQPEAHVRAVADAAACGGRWIVSLDPSLAAGVHSRQDTAIQAWKKILGACDFFRSHDDWRQYLPIARMAVVSDFSGENEFLSQETLNMLTRNSQPCQIFEKDRLSDTDLKGTRAAICPDSVPPSPELRRKLSAYVDSGGCLIAQPKWGQAEGKLLPADASSRYAFYSLGKGQIAIAKQNMDDAYQLAKDVPAVVSHRHDLLRVFNANAAIAYYTVPRRAGSGLLQVINYAGWSRMEVSGPMTVRIAERYRSARLRTIEEPEAKSVEISYKQGGSLVLLPTVPVYAAVELGA
jgi:hypothetical protein